MNRSDNIALIKLLLLLIFLTIMAAGFAQNNLQFNLNGTVRNVVDKTPVPNCEVVLKSSDGASVKTITNPAGEYTFSLKPELNYEVAISLNTSVNTPTARQGFLSSDDKGAFNTIGLKVSKNFQKDFNLQPSTGGPTFNSINFIFNDTSYHIIYPVNENYIDYDSSEFETKNVLVNLKNMLDKNPTILIQLSGHASSNEKNADALSKLRAEKVKNDLVKLGINEKRLVTTGFGKKKLRAIDEQIKKAGTKEEKEKMHASNRRVVFKIFSWEFNETDSVKKEMPIYKAPQK